MICGKIIIKKLNIKFFSTIEILMLKWILKNYSNNQTKNFLRDQQKKKNK